jgi:hypothetical protein
MVVEKSLDSRDILEREFHEMGERRETTRIFRTIRFFRGFRVKDSRLCTSHVPAGFYLLTHPQIGVKFRPMYRHPHRKRLFHRHFFGMIVSAFRR